MKQILIKDIQKDELKKISGGGNIAKTLGKALHYIIDQFYKTAEIESTYSHTGSF